MQTSKYVTIRLSVDELICLHSVAHSLSGSDRGTVMHIALCADQAFRGVSPDHSPEESASRSKQRIADFINSLSLNEIHLLSLLVPYIMTHNSDKADNIDVDSGVCPDFSQLIKESFEQLVRQSMRRAAEGDDSLIIDIINKSKDGNPDAE